MSDVAIRELNAFLKGRYMGIHAYENFIENAEDVALKNLLQEIQEKHKNHASKIATRIQNLGGRPVADVGFVGSMAEIFNAIKGTPETTDEIIKSAIKGEDYYSLYYSREIVKGDIDPDSQNLVNEIISEDKTSLEKLNSYRH